MKYGYTELLRMYGYRKSLGMTEGVRPRMHSARRLCVSTVSSTPMLPRAGPLAQVSNYSVPMLLVAPPGPHRKKVAKGQIKLPDGQRKIVQARPLPASHSCIPPQQVCCTHAPPCAKQSMVRAGHAAQWRVPTPDLPQ